MLKGIVTLLIAYAPQNKPIKSSEAPVQGNVKKYNQLQARRQCKEMWKSITSYNLDYNIFEFYNVFLQIRLTASKTNRDI